MLLCSIAENFYSFYSAILHNKTSNQIYVLRVQTAVLVNSIEKRCPEGTAGMDFKAGKVEIHLHDK